MSGYIKYFEYGSPNMSFLIKDDEVGEKYEQIWDVIKNKLKIKFHSEPVYEYKYLKTKVKEYDGVIKTNFLGNGIPKENMHYTCIACITIDSVMKMDKKYFLQVYLEECKHKIKIKMSRFINAELVQIQVQMMIQIMILILIRILILILIMILIMIQMMIQMMILINNFK